MRYQCTSLAGEEVTLPPNRALVWHMLPHDTAVSRLSPAVLDCPPWAGGLLLPTVPCSNAEGVEALPVRPFAKSCLHTRRQAHATASCPMQIRVRDDES